ncbi:MAG: DEAD/DEAH box helicase [Planctomycetes bacterium]|nr:DEAD/DEAH box helicase [Planctomycetota bacterium]
MDRDALCSAFIEALPYDPYPFQEEAILAWFEADGGLLVTAPTGMGKTLIAEAAVFEALHTGKRLYYTTPLIALTDQKLQELQDRAEAWGFSRDDVGLLTGNRQVNPDAVVLVVVAEILLNHLLAPDRDFGNVSAVVMDEFHYFNDRERGVVWELSLVLLPKEVRLMLLSATVGNAIDFTVWLRDQHQRTLRLIQTDERKVALEFAWVEDKLLTEQLVAMVSDDDALARTPALVFCFSRDECWETAERLKGLPLISKETQAEITRQLADEDMSQGIGPKLQQMLIRGAGVHHAGILPRYKHLVERLFTERLVPFVACTETLAAGINLPARSVVLKTILKGKPGERKVLPSADAHQMFGRAGRPQYDTEGYVFCLAHEDDVKIHRWKEKYDQLPAKATDPGILKARKALERKRPTRRKTEQYWTEGQFESLVKAGPAKLASRSMIPYRFLAFLLLHGETVGEIRRFLRRRFADADRLTGFENQLDAMLKNLEKLGFLARRGFVPQKDVDDPGFGEDTQLELDESLERLLVLRGIDPLYGDFLVHELAFSNFEEKLLALESVLDVPHKIARAASPPYDLAPGPLQKEVLEPTLIKMGVNLDPLPPPSDDEPRIFYEWDDPDRPKPPPTFAEMLEILFQSRLAVPEEIPIQTKWIAGGVLETQGEFFRFTGSRNLAKSEGIVLRHLLRLVLLAREFEAITEDPDYTILAEKVTAVCEAVDVRYTRHLLDVAEDQAKLES